MGRRAPARPRRADALRNQAVVLARAVEVLREQGTDVSVEEIARRAGVGAGTVMRSFGSKAKLLDAAIVQLLTPLVQRFHQATLREDVEQQLCSSLLELAVFQHANRGVSGALDAREMPATFALRRQLEAYASQLIGRAQSEGVVRGDLEVTDVALLLSGIGHVAAASGASPAQLERYVTVLLDGLRAKVAGPPQRPPLPRNDDGALLGGCEKSVAEDERARSIAEAERRLARMKQTGEGIPADEVFDSLRARARGEPAKRTRARKPA